MSDSSPLMPEQEAAARLLVARATTHIDRAPDLRWLRALVRRTSRGRWTWPPAGAWLWSPAVGAATWWGDSDSVEREGWRTRTAYLDELDDPVFEIDYQVCRRCRLGWVELPHTQPDYQRLGLASAALAALRINHAHRVAAWHTLGEHERDARPFWNAAARGVTGGYEQRELCRHVGGLQLR